MKDYRWLLLFLVLAAVILLLFAGCYTILKHPVTSEITDYQPERQQCVDCHHNGIPGYRDPFYYGRYRYGWWNYYGKPWWKDYYYDSPDRDWRGGAGGFTAPDPKVTGRRHLWTDSAGGANSPPAKASKPDESAKASDKKDEKKSDQKKEEKKKEDTKRNLWKDK